LQHLFTQLGHRLHADAGGALGATDARGVPEDKKYGTLMAARFAAAGTRHSINLFYRLYPYVLVIRIFDRSVLILYLL
jgi:hypothetical protein